MMLSAPALTADSNCGRKLSSISRGPTWDTAVLRPPSGMLCAA